VLDLSQSLLLLECGNAKVCFCQNVDYWLNWKKNGKKEVDIMIIHLRVILWVVGSDASILLKRTFIWTKN
jgi:hypothetical protein